MTDWRYDRKNRQWEVTIDDWRAFVIRTDQGDAWHTIIERIGSHHERDQGPDFTWPQEARAWCEAEIARRRAAEEAV